MRIEHIIFGNLIENEEFGRKVIPFLKEEYFTDIVDRKIFSVMNMWESITTFLQNLLLKLISMK
jgi:hypothetical protein